MNLDELRAAADEAFLPALLPAVAALTGRLDLVGHQLRPTALGITAPGGGMSTAQRAAAVDLVVDAMHRWVADGCPDPQMPGDTELHELLRFCCGDEIDSAYLPLLKETLSLDGTDPRTPGWTASQIADNRDFTVAIVGAGISGLAMAYRCLQAGIRFVLLEKNDDVGGTWLENTYPGCRVDLPGHLYCFGFAPRDDWAHGYPEQREILDYLRSCRDELIPPEHIRFGTEVVAARFDEATCTWELQLDTPTGRDSLIANVVISAVGQLNRPHIPHIAGAERFAGTSFHSAQWDHAVGLTDRHVAVIGTGASAAQLVPQIAKIAASVSVFQRTPAWFLPGDDYRDRTPPGQQWLCRNIPDYSRWYRLVLFHWFVDGLFPFTVVDPEWTDPGRSVSALNDKMRKSLTAHLATLTAGDQQLFERLLPDYPPTAKRMIRDDGSWVRALTRDNVHLVVDPINRIEPDRIVTTGQTEHRADVIVYSTGFRAADFLSPMRITGRDGRDLHDHWSGDARAYLGVTVPRFPNLFCLYGPNTNIVLTGSTIWLSECEVDYAMGCIELLLRTGHGALDCRTDVHDAYNTRIDAMNSRTAWGTGTVNTWYRNAHGRIAQNWPGTLLEFWQQTRRPDPDDYRFLDPS